jgi:hypothetical protein
MKEFIQKFNELVRTYVDSIETNGLGMVLSIKFKDGSCIGIARLFNEIGFHINVPKNKDLWKK